MSCITKGNVRCTKCCEVLHINKTSYQRHIKDKEAIYQSNIMFGRHGAWAPVSYRVAKKINPYLAMRGSKEDRKWLRHNMQYFTCKHLVKGVGCSVRETDLHPWTCKQYAGGLEYSPTCTTDISIIARSTTT